MGLRDLVLAHFLNELVMPVIPDIKENHCVISYSFLDALETCAIVQATNGYAVSYVGAPSSVQVTFSNPSDNYVVRQIQGHARYFSKCDPDTARTINLARTINQRELVTFLQYMKSAVHSRLAPLLLQPENVPSLPS
jgi:hypothetical protein